MGQFQVLIGCEESQAICLEFRKLGFEAFSCDLKPSSGGRPEWHLQMDVFEAIKLRKWDLMIAHPECTYLTVTANKWLKDQPPRQSGALVGAERREARNAAINFFLELYYCNIPRLVIENPIGVMSSVFRKPDQVIQPWMFGDDASKATCLWMKGLPKLKIDTENLYPPVITKDGKKRWANQCPISGANNLGPSLKRAELRSKTYPGIAKALAQQYSDFLLSLP